jgi:hypothetical protein
VDCVLLAYSRCRCFGRKQCCFQEYNEKLQNSHTDYETFMTCKLLGFSVKASGTKV